MKKILFLALVLVLAVMVPITAVAQATPLRFMYYIDASQAGYEEDQAIWQKFKDDNPDIDLQMEILFNQPFHEKLGAYIAAGTIPDVIYMWPSNRSSSAILHQMHLMKGPAASNTNNSSAQPEPKEFFMGIFLPSRGECCRCVMAFNYRVRRPNPSNDSHAACSKCTTNYSISTGATRKWDGRLACLASAAAQVIRRLRRRGQARRPPYSPVRGEIRMVPMAPAAPDRSAPAFRLSASDLL